MTLIWLQHHCFFVFFSIPSVCTSHHWNGFLWDPHGWEVITRDGNRISTPFVTLKHLISILKRYLIFITLTHISIVIVLFSHKLRMQMTKRAAICFQSMHRKSWGEKKTTQKIHSCLLSHWLWQQRGVPNHCLCPVSELGVSFDPIELISVLIMMLALFILIVWLWFFLTPACQHPPHASFILK